ncbi:hypothetical protein J6590_082050 [Homalodisca vitripennis]|nr:hypothetical protein J6590_082050 [Homalodisca vitripennis]
MKFLKEEMVLLESRAKESQESANRYTATALADMKFLKEEMVLLESRAKESQESVNRYTATALVIATDMRHCTPHLHADHISTTLSIEEDYHRSANSRFSLPEYQTATILFPIFLSSSILKKYKLCG